MKSQSLDLSMHGSEITVSLTSFQDLVCVCQLQLEADYSNGIKSGTTVPRDPDQCLIVSAQESIFVEHSVQTCRT